MAITANQYKVGRVEVKKGSSVVKGLGTKWLYEVKENDVFKIKGEDAIYFVDSVQHDQQLTLKSNYGGESKDNVEYIIHRCFTTNYLLPLLSGKVARSGGYTYSQLSRMRYTDIENHTYGELFGIKGYEGDEDVAELYRYAMRKIDSLMKSVEG